MEIPEISDSDLKHYQGVIDYFNLLLQNDIEDSNVDLVLLMLEDLFSYFICIKKHTYFYQIFRLTVNRSIHGTNKRIRDIRHLKYPPADKVTKY